MKILLAHNRYRQEGGEDTVFGAERRLLESRGHDVVPWERCNDEIVSHGLRGRLGLAARTVWNWESHRDLGRVLERERPDVAHFINTFPLISPAAYDACRVAGVPVVQSLQNYRLLCPAASFMRNERPCEDCATKTLFEGVRHGCYRGSRAQTAVVASMLAIHRWRGTWADQVDAYVALHDFARERFVAGGLPADRVHVRPNFLSGNPTERSGRGDYALFVGRLSTEKGVRTLLEAWSGMPEAIPLRIAGDGPMHAEVERAARVLPRVELLGWLRGERVYETLRCARFLVLPSEWYEGLPLTAVEAFASGVPILASRIGGLPEVVEDGRNGLLFTPGDAAELAERASWLWRKPDASTRMGKEARRDFESRYSADAAHESLMRIYASAGAAV